MSGDDCGGFDHARILVDGKRDAGDAVGLMEQELQNVSASKWCQLDDPF